MSEHASPKWTHTDVDLLRARLPLSAGQRLQAMFDARALLVGIIRGRLRQQHPGLSEADLNFMMLKEVERAQSVRRPEFLS